MLEEWVHGLQHPLTQDTPLRAASHAVQIVNTTQDHVDLGGVCAKGQQEHRNPPQQAIGRCQHDVQFVVGILLGVCVIGERGIEGVHQGTLAEDGAEMPLQMHLVSGAVGQGGGGVAVGRGALGIVQTVPGTSHGPHRFAATVGIVVEVGVGSGVAVGASAVLTARLIMSTSPGQVATLRGAEETVALLGGTAEASTVGVAAPCISATQITVAAIAVRQIASSSAIQVCAGGVVSAGGRDMHPRSKQPGSRSPAWRRSHGSPQLPNRLSAR